MRLRHPLSFLLPLALSFTACLPSSQRTNERALTPSDSLSRQIAEAAPVDTLRLVGTGVAPEDAPLEYPSTLLWLPDSLGSTLVVDDTRTGALHRFTASDTGLAHAGRWQPEGLAFPYLAGHRTDTLVVLNRGENRLDFVYEGAVVRSVPLPITGTSAALATDRGLFVKRAVEDEESALVRLNYEGEVTAHYPLAGPYWRHIGFLRAWGDSLLSLSGYRPVADVLAPDTPEGTVLDTLALQGFDSPLLVRSYQFMAGDTDEPPLLTSAAAALEDRLYVLNIRIDAIRIDEYARSESGLRLQRALVFLDPEGLRDGFPADLAVRRAEDGSLRFVVLLQRPGGMLQRSGGRLIMLRAAA